MPEPLIGFGLSRRASLEHHLQYNHYPPVDLRWVAVAEAAIDKAASTVEWSEDGLGYCDVPDLDEQIGQIDGFDQGKTVREVMDGLHLWDFVTAGVEAFQDEPKAGE